MLDANAYQLREGNASQLLGDLALRPGHYLCIVRQLDKHGGEWGSIDYEVAVFTDRGKENIRRFLEVTERPGVNRIRYDYWVIPEHVLRHLEKSKVI